MASLITFNKCLTYIRRTIRRMKRRPFGRLILWQPCVMLIVHAPGKEARVMPDASNCRRGDACSGVLRDVLHGSLNQAVYDGFEVAGLAVDLKLLVG